MERRPMRVLIVAWALLWASAGRPVEGVTIQYSYDVAGRLTAAEYGGGKRIDYQYDSGGNLVRRTVTVPEDSDGDSMDDAWEREQFGDLAREGWDDFDDDGQTDLAEYLTGTDPKDPSSRLAIEAAVAGVGQAMTLEWQGVPGRQYRVQWKESLDDTSWIDLEEVVCSGPGVLSVTDREAGEFRQRFYRIVVVE